MQSVVVGRRRLRMETAATPLEKFIGLMFRRSLGHALVFVLGRETRLGASIHSFFVFFPFDAAWLDGRGRVVDLASVRPFTPNVTPKKPAAYIVELPAGTIRKSGIKIGDKVGLPPNCF
jgi:uncharacterized membrane protein (UPF0127 family)